MARSSRPTRTRGENRLPRTAWQRRLRCLFPVGRAHRRHARQLRGYGRRRRGRAPLHERLPHQRNRRAPHLRGDTALHPRNEDAPRRAPPYRHLLQHDRHVPTGPLKRLTEELHAIAAPIRDKEGEYSQPSASLPTSHSSPTRRTRPRAPIQRPGGGGQDLSVPALQRRRRSRDDWTGRMTDPLFTVAAWVARRPLRFRP